MEADLSSGVVPALVVIGVVLVFEDWAYFKARTKLQRALITGAAVFVLVVIFNIPWNGL